MNLDGCVLSSLPRLLLLLTVTTAARQSGIAIQALLKKKVLLMNTKLGNFKSTSPAGAQALKAESEIIRPFLRAHPAPFP